VAIQGYTANLTGVPTGNTLATPFNTVCLHLNHHSGHPGVHGGSDRGDPGGDVRAPAPAADPRGAPVRRTSPTSNHPCRATLPSEQPCRATLPSNPAEQPCANPFVDLIWSLGARLMIGLIIPAGLLAGVFVFLYIRRMAGADHAPRISAASRAILANASLKSGVSVE
jgi:hypothetical protein